MRHRERVRGSRKVSHQDAWSRVRLKKRLVYQITGTGMYEWSPGKYQRVWFDWKTAHLHTDLLHIRPQFKNVVPGKRKYAFTGWCSDSYRFVCQGYPWRDYPKYRMYIASKSYFHKFIR